MREKVRVAHPIKGGRFDVKHSAGGMMDAEFAVQYLVLAHAALVAETTGIVPLLLLDEVIAHLDPNRRAALFAELAKLGAQVWLSGADPAAFAELHSAGEIFNVDNGRVTRRI